MPHYVANESAGPRVGEREHIEKVAADSRCWNVAMMELERALFGRSATRERRVVLRQKYLLDVQRFTGTPEFQDDVCLLSVEFTEACAKLR